MASLRFILVSYSMNNNLEIGWPAWQLESNWIWIHLSSSDK